jgi:hypothetical protein
MKSTIKQIKKTACAGNLPYKLKIAAQVPKMPRTASIALKPSLRGRIDLLRPWQSMLTWFLPFKKVKMDCHALRKTSRKARNDGTSWKGCANGNDGAS